MKNCLNCGNPLEGDTCILCLAEQSKCVLCLKKFNIGEEVILCWECLYLGHADEMEAWLEIRSVCPTCRIDYSPDIFTKVLLEDQSLQEFVQLRNKLLSQRKEIFDQFRFRLPFYDFQTSLVLQIKKHLETHRSFLLVSPPGSGKTIIGLSLARELGKHVLVLTPNLAVLGSWLDRATMFFEPSDVSINVHHVIGKEKGFLRPITITTYQRLNQDIRSSRRKSNQKTRRKETRKNINKNMPMKKNSNEKKGKRNKIPDMILEKRSGSLIERLKKHDIGLIILDEAHRLTQQWGEDVRYLLSQLPDAKVLGLTATPPERMKADFREIFPRIHADIPRHLLVREGILVPYQDLVCILPIPSQDDTDAAVIKKASSSSLDDFREKALEELQQLWNLQEEVVQHGRTLMALLLNDPRTSQQFKEKTRIFHGWKQRPNRSQEPITDKKVRTRFLDQLHWDFRLVERLMTTIWTEIMDEMEKLGVESPSTRIMKKHAEHLISLIGTSKGKNFEHFFRSMEWVCWNLKWKLYHALEILRFEYQQLGDDIRAMIILDQESLPSKFHFPLTGIHGAIGAFEALVTTDPLIDELDPIMVTGKSILVDDDLADRFLSLSDTWVEQQQLNVKFYIKKPRSRFYVIMKGKGKDWSTDTYTRIITWLFEQGITKCLVGTRFLLGEGWDSLTLNTIIDLTSIAAGTTVNQVKGRALRKDPNNPYKVSNIWEFISHPLLTPYSQEEYETFARKHQNYWGIDKKGRIRNGVTRLDKGLYPGGVRNDPFEINRRSMERARDRLKARQLWKVGVKLGDLYYGFNIQFPHIFFRTIDLNDFVEALTFVFQELTKPLEASAEWKILTSRTDDTREFLICTPVTTSRDLVEALLNTFKDPNWDEGMIIRLEPPLKGITYRLYKWAKLRRQDKGILGNIARHFYQKYRIEHAEMERQREFCIGFPKMIPIHPLTMTLSPPIGIEEMDEIFLKKYLSHQIQVMDVIRKEGRLIPPFQKLYLEHLRDIELEHVYID